MASSSVPVFIDSSLGTHIAISVSPNLTVAVFKRKFEREHSKCYPGIGHIKVNGLMVKRKSHLYHLPESMPIKHAFLGFKGTWFLYTEAHLLNKKIPSTPQSKVNNCNLSQNIQKKNACSFVEPTSERPSVSVAVSGVIKKYFFVNDDDDEVTSNNSKPRMLSKYARKTPPTMSSVRASRVKKMSDVGKQLIVAANNLGISTSDQKPFISLCKYKCNNSTVLKSSSVVRHPVFELADE